MSTEMKNYFEGSPERSAAEQNFSWKEPPQNEATFRGSRRRRSRPGSTGSPQIQGITIGARQLDECVRLEEVTLARNHQEV